LPRINDTKDYKFYILHCWKRSIEPARTDLGRNIYFKEIIKLIIKIKINYAERKINCRKERKGD